MVGKGSIGKREVVGAACLILFFLFQAGCATVNLPGMHEEGYSVEDDEARLFKRADEACEQIDEGGYLYENPLLVSYLNEVMRKLVSDKLDYNPVSVNVKVIKDPSFNAFALPNGRLYVHTGLLAAIDDEAQLAALLGHEFTHTLERHTLKQFRSAVNKSAFFSAITVPLAAFGGNLAAVLSELVYISSIYGYSQTLEREADVEGFEWMVEAGYEPESAQELFQHLEDYIKDEEIKLPFFFSTHPAVKSRQNNFKQLTDEYRKEGRTNAGIRNQATYIDDTNQLVLDNAIMCLDAGSFKSAQRNIEKFSKNNPYKAIGYYLMGELYRERNDKIKKKPRDKDQDFQEALGHYDKALSLDNYFADAYKGKGRVYLRLKDNKQASENFAKYLEISPIAEDKDFIKQYIID